MKRLIIFLIRKRLGLKKGEPFRFTGQYSKENYYYFSSNTIKKVTVYDKCHNKVSNSNVSLNWLLDDGCSIEKVRGNADEENTNII